MSGIFTHGLFITSYILFNASKDQGNYRVWIIKYLVKINVRYENNTFFKIFQNNFFYFLIKNLRIEYTLIKIINTLRRYKITLFNIVNWEFQMTFLH